MSHSNTMYRGGSARRVLVALAALACVAGTASAATPGITASAGGGSTFNLVANQGYSSQPDGAQIYSWGYGCAGAATYTPPAFAPVGFCPTMQLPGPTLVVNEGTAVTITLTNNLPTGAGNTSIVFAGIPVTSAVGGTAGLLAQEATPGPGGSVTYTLNTTGKAGTHAYYSGTQPDLQIEMGLYGAIVVIPTTVQTGCVGLGGRLGGGEEYRLWANAYDHPATCYDREYLFQFSEIDPRIHTQAEA